ncbi:AP endonuclease family 2 [Bodo saltans virus]|uniref:AP endonuclease family 2 n=1 Tax=Bodo saltans virus TaxID=2024608 RepID=A0A2H4UU70_9VIRU|nr:AP endonuclease family 2 [Bodo saltans virus]ATZ80481.1 AP endonuclease family 2 [Bodo saltans virus]
MHGVHINSAKNEIIESLNDAINHKAKVVQFFVDTNKKYNNIYNAVKIILKKNKIKSIVHISYTINCCQDWDKYSWWLSQLIDEIKLANEIGAYACVLHLGKKMGLSLDDSVNNMYTSLMHVYEKIENTQIKILFETSTGQGTEIGYKLNELSMFYRKFSKHNNINIRKKFGICLDTCHIFNAGYNIKNRESRDIFFSEFNELIGLNEIKLIHLNDSLNHCGALVDRHENIGFGYIGKNALLIFVEVFGKLHVPIVLETPSKNIYKDLSIINKIK